MRDFYDRFNIPYKFHESWWKHYNLVFVQKCHLWCHFYINHVFFEVFEKRLPSELKITATNFPKKICHAHQHLCKQHLLTIFFWVRQLLIFKYQRQYELINKKYFKKWYMNMKSWHFCIRDFPNEKLRFDMLILST